MCWPSSNVDNSSQGERYIVLMRSNSDAASISRITNFIAKNKGRINRKFVKVPAIAVELSAIDAQLLLNDPAVLVVEPDAIVMALGVELDNSWSVDHIDADQSWTKYTGKGVSVGVIDTGIASHQDLIIAGGSSFVSYTTSYQDDNGHGTHVAGTIGARYNNIGGVGVAPEVNLYAIKVLEQSGSGYLSDIIAGIEWAITNKMHIVNMSLGMKSDSPTLKDAVDKAYESGVLVVAAAGNSGNVGGKRESVEYPARYESVIAVGATDQSNNRAYFSSTGSAVEIAAPGVGIRSTYLDGKYAISSGTSMASPHVAGTLALLKQANPKLSVTDLRNLLISNGRDEWYGYGLVNAKVVHIKGK